MDRLLQHTIPIKSSDCPKNEDTPVERIVVILHLKTSCQHPLIKHTQIHAPTQETPQKPTAPTQLRKALSFNATPQRLLQEVARTHIFPVTFFTAFPRLPFALVPFAFSQFILIEALAHQGWIEIIANWLVRESNRQIYPAIWLIGILGVILCNVSGTDISATISLTKVVRSADFPDHSSRAAAIALAVASNIGAVNFTFSASLTGLLWRQILELKGIFMKQTTFAYWNILPLIVMTSVGLAVVCTEMAVLSRP